MIALIYLASICGAWASPATSPSTERMLCVPNAGGEWDCSAQAGTLQRRRQGAPIPQPDLPSASPANSPANAAATPNGAAARTPAVAVAPGPNDAARNAPIALAEPPRRQRIRILEQPRSAWAIQLIATTSQDALERVATTYDLFDRSAVRLASGTSVRYALVWDVYPTRAEAEAALRELPAALRAMKPWVRGVGSLQDAMNAATRLSPVRRPDA